MKRSSYCKGDRVVARGGKEFVATADEDYDWRVAAWEKNDKLPMPIPASNKAFWDSFGEQ